MTLAPAIELRNVAMAYLLKRGLVTRRKFWALEDVTFTLYRGESLGVVGKNGSGKSTLLRLLAGVVKPDRGVLINHGVTTSLLSLNLGFLPYLSGRENAILGGMFQGLDYATIKSKVDEIIEFAELEDFIDEPLFAYSSGMQARLAFAVAFQVNPDVLLIDEVIGVGDQDFQEKSMALMKQRMKSKETTIVFVSHNGHLLREVCDRCVWIENRVTRSEGHIERVLGEYGNYLASQRDKRATG